MTQDILKRLLDLVVAYTGKDSAAKQLRIPVAIIEDWMRGDESIPEQRLIDLIDALEEALRK